MCILEPYFQEGYLTDTDKNITGTDEQAAQKNNENHKAKKKQNFVYTLNKEINIYIYRINLATNKSSIVKIQKQFIFRLLITVSWKYLNFSFLFLS